MAAQKAVRPDVTATWWVSVTASRPKVRRVKDDPSIDVETIFIEGIASGGAVTGRLFGEDI